METENKLPQRKPLRLQNYNYNSNGSYFITFCTYKRKNTLVSNFAIDQSHILTRVAVNLSESGKIAENVIAHFPNNFGVKIDCFVIMPNHIHMILSINDETMVEQSATRTILSKAIGYIKMNISKEICSNIGKQNVWQRGFYDHVIRNQQDYDEITKYIQENPYKWNLDSLYNEDLPVIPIK